MKSSHYVLVNLLKIVLVVLLIFVLFVVGTMIGFGVLGDGKMTAVFDKEVWQHIIDFLK